MAIVRVYDCPGWSIDQYDQVIEKIGAGGGGLPSGILFHAAGATAGGVRVVEGYESVEIANQFIESKVAPTATELGLPLPQMSGFTVHRAVGLPGA